jgi:hypothetical protein
MFDAASSFGVGLSCFLSSFLKAMKEFSESRRATELMYWPYVRGAVTGGGLPGNVSPGKASRSDAASSGTSFEPVLIKHSIDGTL